MSHAKQATILILSLIFCLPAFVVGGFILYVLLGALFA